MVFGLPFNIERFFRPTMLDVFGFTNTQLGDLFVIYGIAAMLSYFPGGALADRFPARNLLTASLFATSAGGLYMATIPGPVGMGVLYGFWVHLRLHVRQCANRVQLSSAERTWSS